MLERGFSIFWIFLLFFSEFSCPSRVWTEIGAKIFFLYFSAYQLPFWLKIIPERDFFNFLTFFWNFLARAEYERNSGLKFFHSFSANIIPFGLNIIPERGFLIFFLFFSEFSCPGWVWMEFGTKFFFSFSQPILSRFGWK